MTCKGGAKEAAVSLPIKKFIPLELQARRDKGLCYNCNERYFPGHECRSQSFLLLQQDNESTPDNFQDLDILKDQEDIPQISLYVMMAQNSPNTIRIRGKTKNRTIF